MEQDRELIPRDDRQHLLQPVAQLPASMQRLGLAPAMPAPEAPAAPEPPIKVPDRWRTLLRLMRDGLACKRIAGEMHRHPSTLRTHREGIFKTYGDKGKAALVGWAVVNNLV